jgi:outer membrane autotransporter protein
VGFKAALNYTANDAVLELKPMLDTSGLNINQTNVATALKDFFTGGGALPPAFVTVFGLSGANLGSALSQLSGEAATGVQQAGLHSMDLFLNAMLDPFVAGRGASAGPALAYGSEPRRSPDIDSAFAMFTKAPKTVAPEKRLHTWGATYGGYNSLDGDAIVGSHNVIDRTGGFAGGADYKVSSDTVFGAAMAMEGWNWGLSGGLGGGRAEAAKFGVYGSTRWSDAYLSAAVAGGWYRASTSRTVRIGAVDQLESDFDGSTLGARLEGGNRFSLPGFGLTPYAALQLESVHTPGFAERSSSSLFGLTYASETVTDTRSELGAWIDTRRVLGNGMTLLLRGRGAWVHDFDPDRHLTPAFEALPGASFVVNGASAAGDAALASAAAELTLRRGLRFIAKFDGQFADGSETLAATATLRATW